MFKFSLEIVLLVAVFSNVERLVEGAQQFKRCYNTSEEEMHCFDVQYDNATNQPFFTSFQNAQRRCNDLNSTLVTIKNEEIDNLVQQFMNEAYSPIGNQYFWLNAYQVSYYDNPNRWHWLNSTLSNIPGSDVSFTYDSGWYTAVLEFRTDNGGPKHYLTAKQPQSNFYYVCEYSVLNCPSANSDDVRMMNGRWYVAVHVQELVTWYKARSKCLKDGGDLASFANVASINFTSWLGSDPNVKYWIGLRFIWYTWGDQGQELKYTNWAKNGDSPKACVILCFNCDPLRSWSPRDCTDNMYVVCHTITSIKMATTTTSTSVVSTAQTTDRSITMSNFTGETFPSKEGSAPSPVIPVAFGVGVGVGVPVIAGIIVLTICIVRKRRHATASSVQSANLQHAESSFDQPVDERYEVGDSTTYGVVVPSKSPSEAAEANEANSPTEQTVYAPLQIL